jgi:hypothetical protein
MRVAPSVALGGCMQDSNFDDDHDGDEPDVEDLRTFPIAARDLGGVAFAIRAQIKCDPDEQRADLTAALDAIARLPAPTDDQISISASDRYGSGAGREAGNYEWAQIEITDDAVTCSCGEHFYDSDVGGDSESGTIFFCDIDGFVKGDLRDWLYRFERLASYGVHAFSEAAHAAAPDVEDIPGEVRSP